MHLSDGDGGQIVGDLATGTGGDFAMSVTTDLAASVTGDFSASVTSDLATAPADLRMTVPPDLASSPDLSVPSMKVGRGPEEAAPFSLGADGQGHDPASADNGLRRDPMGYLTLDTTHVGFDVLWLANTDDMKRGSVSKLDSRTVRETARYLSVTCFSNPQGSSAQCDGTMGCCTADDSQRLANRIKGMGNGGGPHQSVMQISNDPSRTAVDWNGDVWVANRAFSGQGSVTKIANEKSACIDRNQNGVIDTSSDVNGDGAIQTDCNGDGVPDDIASVKARACANGKAQEFFGVDDECILFTTNVGPIGAIARPLVLGAGKSLFGPSDPWAATYNDGVVHHLDGATGQLTETGLLPNANPYGATIDSSGVLWAPNDKGGGIVYLDTRKLTNAGTVRQPNGGVDGYGIAMDRDQNVWTAGYKSASAFRYTPDRTNGGANLGKGFWTVVTNPGANTLPGKKGGGNGRGIAVDSRTPNLFYAWMARDSGWIVRVDASKLALPQGQDVIVDGSGMAAVQVDGTQTIGAGVDADQNIWGVSQNGSVATRIRVDAAGAMTAPDITSLPANGLVCPAGDRCPYDGPGNRKQSPHPYTYSDFTGFGLRNFTLQRGLFSFVANGCGNGKKTRWLRVVWVSDVPMSTQLTARARSGPTAMPDGSWGSWTPDQPSSPASLLGVLTPNANASSNFLQVEFDLSTSDRAASPRLKDFELFFDCN